MVEGEGTGEAEEVLLAFDLLNKYRKDKTFIQKDIQATKKQGQKIIQTQEMTGQPPRKPKYEIDPLLTQEERHKIIAEKREKRR